MHTGVRKLPCKVGFHRGLLLFSRLLSLLVAVVVALPLLLLMLVLVLVLVVSAVAASGIYGG